MILLRTMQARGCTIGFLEYEDFSCFTLELPWLMNKESQSCIPQGMYTYRKHDSAKNGPCLMLDKVPGRSWIQIHSGNYTHQIEGCILPGDSLKDINQDGIPDVANSRRTLIKLLNLVPEVGKMLILR